MTQHLTIAQIPPIPPMEPSHLIPQTVPMVLMELTLQMELNQQIQLTQRLTHLAPRTAQQTAQDPTVLVQTVLRLNAQLAAKHHHAAKGTALLGTALEIIVLLRLAQMSTLVTMTNNPAQIQQMQQTLLLQLFLQLFAQLGVATQLAIKQLVMASSVPQLSVFSSVVGIRDAPQATVLSQTALELLQTLALLEHAMPQLMEQTQLQMLQFKPINLHQYAPIEVTTGSAMSPSALD